MYHYRVVSIDRVIDGDTVDVTLDLGFSLYLKQRVRVLGIDTPELRSRDPEERSSAQIAKAFAEQWFSEGSFTVTTYKDDKYGRMLGDFRKEGAELSFSEAVLDAGVGEVYSG